MLNMHSMGIILLNGTAMLVTTLKIICAVAIYPWTLDINDLTTF